MTPKAYLLGAIVAAVSSAALAQPVVVGSPSWSDADDVLVRQYYTEAPAPEVEYHQTLTPGSAIPSDVPLKLFPASAAPNLRGYAYFVSVDRKLVVVEADTRRVVRILTTQ
jgi:hypothetical protein